MNENKRTRGNGSGTAFKRGNKWVAQVTAEIEKDAEGKVIRRRYKTCGGFKTKREALAYIPQLREEPTREQEQRANITFEALYALWSARHYPTLKSGQAGYKAAYDKCGRLYKRVFAELKAADLQTVVDECEMSRRTKAGLKSLLVNMYKYAMENDYTDKNYAEFVKLPKREKSRKDAFSRDERDKLWTAYNSGHDFVGYILIMIYTGMRYGEISIITKDRIHLAERCMIGGIKTNAGTDREIPIADCIYPIIERLCARPGQKILDMFEKKFYATFYNTLEVYGIRKLNPHCCRHTTATALAEAGVQPAIITAILGHEDYSTTLQYTHIPLADKITAINAIR